MHPSWTAGPLHATGNILRCFSQIARVDLSGLHRRAGGAFRAALSGGCPQKSPDHNIGQLYMNNVLDYLNTVVVST